MRNLIHDLGIDPIQQPREDGFAGLPDDAQDDPRDDQTHDWIRQRLPQPDPDRTE